jgi:hypothetical protein
MGTRYLLDVRARFPRMRKSGCVVYFDRNPLVQARKKYLPGQRGEIVVANSPGRDCCGDFNGDQDQASNLYLSRWTYRFSPIVFAFCSFFSSNSNGKYVGKWP